MSFSKLNMLVADQDGYFSQEQARDLGISPQAIHYHRRTGTIERVRRGIYRLSSYPPSERGDLAVMWLWSQQLGIFSHTTALSLHGLSDLLPERIHMTLPESEKSRRRRLPTGLMLYYGTLTSHDYEWHGCVPVTTPRRTLLDSLEVSLSPEFLSQALAQAVERGLLDVATIATIAQGIEKTRSV